MIEESDNSRNIQKWKGIKSVEENHHTLFIFVDNIAAYLIPKRYFKNKEHYDEFVNEIEKRIQKS